jgi:hypothetical protein
LLRSRQSRAMLIAARSSQALTSSRIKCGAPRSRAPFRSHPDSFEEYPALNNTDQRRFRSCWARFGRTFRRSSFPRNAAIVKWTQEWDQFNGSHARWRRSVLSLFISGRWWIPIHVKFGFPAAITLLLVNPHSMPSYWRCVPILDEIHGPGS